MEDFLFEWFFGWLFSSALGLLAQSAPDANSGGVPITLSGFWLGVYAIGASLAAAIGTMAKLFFDDKDKARKEETARFRINRDIVFGNDRTRRLHVETREWAQDITKFLAAWPGCPPGLHHSSV